jgi:hypothetical protein
VESQLRPQIGKLRGRTRTQALEPLIKRRVISLEDQRPFRQMRHSSCIGHTIDFPFVGMIGLGQQRHEEAFITRLPQVAIVRCEVGL